MKKQDRKIWANVWTITILVAMVGWGFALCWFSPAHQATPVTLCTAVPCESGQYDCPYDDAGCPGGCGLVCREFRGVLPTPTMEGDCIYQEMPVGNTMPIVPECDYRRVVVPSETVQWNAYVKILPTKWVGGIPYGLRWRNVPSLYSVGQGTAFAYCEEPREYSYQCSNSLMYFEEIIYRLPVTELGWHDWGYFGKINKWGWYPLCVTLPGREEVCYTSWYPTPPVVEYVEEWRNTR